MATVATVAIEPAALRSCVPPAVHIPLCGHSDAESSYFALASSENAAPTSTLAVPATASEAPPPRGLAPGARGGDEVSIRPPPLRAVADGGASSGTVPDVVFGPAAS